MLEYKVYNQVANTTYKRYNKLYTTPPIFEYFKFKPVLMICGIVSGLLMAAMMFVYQYVIVVDAALAVAYIVGLFINKNLYCFGVLNRSVAHGTKQFKFAKTMAYVSQMSMYRIVVPGIVFFVTMDWDIFNDVMFQYSIIAALVIFAISTLSVMGIGAKQRFYTYTAQKAYNAILDGPKAFNQEAKTIIADSLDFKLVELNRPEYATVELFNAQERFMSSAKALEACLEQYDDAWRKAIVYGNYTCCKSIGDNNATRYLLSLIETHKQNANELNAIVTKLNTAGIVQTKVNVDVPKKPVKNITKPNKQEPKKTNDFWGNVVNWYN